MSSSVTSRIPCGVGFKNISTSCHYLFPALHSISGTVGATTLTEAQLAAHGLYPVIAGDNPFPQATAPLLRAAFEPLRDASLLCANAFSWAEQAPLLSAHARAGLLQGGAALEDAGFY